MTRLFLIILTFTVDFIFTVEVQDHTQAWVEFKSRNKLTKLNSSEDVLRKNIFSQNLNEIQTHNQRASNRLESYTKGVNQFTHLSFSEVIGLFTGLLTQKPATPNPLPQAPSSGLAATFYSYDLRNTGFVGSIKDQGKCGYYSFVFTKLKVYYFAQ